MTQNTPRWIDALTRGLLLTSLFAAGALFAQRGDHAGEAQPENWRQWDVPPAPVLTPEEALHSFRVAPGFRVELAAAEPLIEDPIAIRFDPHGRLWAIELRAYMPNVDGDRETAPLGTVVVLEDDDHDGRYDRRTEFLTGLVNARALALVEGGVLVAEPPILWYCRDADGDLVSDWKVEVARYGNPDPDHLEHTENALLQTLDNRLVNSKSSRSFRFELDERGNPTIAEVPTAFRGQWGITEDDLGRLFYNSNSSYLFGDPWPAEYLGRGAPSERTIGQPKTFGTAVVTDESVHSIRMNTGINRGYQRGMLRPDGRLARTTSVSGGVIYRGDQFGTAWQRHAFIPEPAGNVVAAFELEPGVDRIRGTQRLFPDSDVGRRAFLASTDERFRPVDAAVGPDGALYVVDLYRGILQHRQFVTSYLRKQILERGLDKPVGLGRIWRIVRDDQPIDRTAPITRFESIEACLDSLGSPNGWTRDTARRLLIEDARPEDLDKIRRVVREGSPRAQLTALWALAGLGAADAPTILRAMSTKDFVVRLTALRVAETVVDSRSRQEIARSVAAALRDPERAVRVQAMFTLGEFTSGAAGEFATASMVEALREHPRDRTLAVAALSGWRDRQSMLLADLAFDRTWPADGSVILEDLAASIVALDPANLESVLDLAGRVAESSPARANAILNGLLRLTERKNFPALELAAPPQLLRHADVHSLSKGLAQLAKKVSWTGNARPTAPPPLEWSSDDRRRAERGAALFGSCAICHGPSGEGLRGLGPNLQAATMLSDDPSAVVRILLDGLSGPLENDGESWDMTMPGQRENSTFDDEAIAGLVTWLGRQWGHRGDPVSPDQVARIRGASESRASAWTIAELRGGVSSRSARALFDGRSLDGWTARGGKATYRVEDASIVGQTAPNTPNTFLCTDDQFGDFELSYEFRIDPELNSGVQIRSRAGEDGIVRGYQVEIDVDPNRARFWSGGIYEEGGRGWLDNLADDPRARAATSIEGWNRVRVVAEGGRLRTWINEVPTADLLDTRALEGFIGLQVHGVGGRQDPLRVRWRDLSIIDRGKSAFRATRATDWHRPGAPPSSTEGPRVLNEDVLFDDRDPWLPAGGVHAIRFSGHQIGRATLHLLGANFTPEGVTIEGRESEEPTGGTATFSGAPAVWTVQRLGDRLVVLEGHRRVYDVRGVEAPATLRVSGPEGAAMRFESFEVLDKVE